MRQKILGKEMQFFQNTILKIEILKLFVDIQINISNSFKLC